MPVVRDRVEDVVIFKVGTSLPQFKDIIGNEVPYWTHFYKLGDILIDTGHINVSGEVLEYIKDSQYVFLTHHHEDHVGNAYLLAEKGVDVYAHELALPLLKNPPNLKTYRKLVWGVPKSFEAKPIGKAPLKELGIKTIYTPGHTIDHLAYKVDNYIFVGDLVAGKKIPMMAFIGEDFREIINSLNKALNEEFDYAFSGMGVLTRDEFSKYLEDLIELKEKVKELYDRGLGIDKIVKEIFPSTPKIVLAIEYVSEGEWSRELLVKSLLGLK